MHTEHHIEAPRSVDSDALDNHVAKLHRAMAAEALSSTVAEHEDWAAVSLAERQARTRRAVEALDTHRDPGAIARGC